MRPSGERVAGPGDPVAPFTLLPYHGSRAVTWRPGRVTVLSFCALWCDTWREQSARLASVRRRLAGLPIDYRTISVDGRWAERFTSGAATESDVLLDSGGQVSGSLGLRAVPWTLVVDAAGVIQLARQGIVRTEELEDCLRGLVTRSAAPTAPTGAILLTFADFPALPPGSGSSPDEELLDILRAAETPVTFFCMADNLAHPAGAAVARRAGREGHRLQIQGRERTPGPADAAHGAEILRRVTGIAPTLYRPSGSAEPLSVSNGHPLSPRLPIVTVYDDQRPGVAELTRRVLFAVRPGVIVALHAGVAETRAALPYLMRELLRRGLRFSTLG